MILLLVTSNRLIFLSVFVCVTRSATTGPRPLTTEPLALFARVGLLARDAAKVALGPLMLRGNLHHQLDARGLAVAGRPRLRGQPRVPARLLIQLPGDLVALGVLPKAPPKERGKEKARVKALVGLVSLPSRRGLRGQLRMLVA